MIDAEKGAGAISAAPFSRDTSLRESEQFQRVAVVITELNAVTPPELSGSRTGPLRLIGRKRQFAMTR